MLQEGSGKGGEQVVRRFHAGGRRVHGRGIRGSGSLPRSGVGPGAAIGRTASRSAAAVLVEKPCGIVAGECDLIHSGVIPPGGREDSAQLRQHAAACHGAGFGRTAGTQIDIILRSGRVVLMNDRNRVGIHSAEGGVLKADRFHALLPVVPVAFEIVSGDFRRLAFPVIDFARFPALPAAARSGLPAAHGLKSALGRSGVAGSRKGEFRAVHAAGDVQFSIVGEADRAEALGIEIKIIVEVQSRLSVLDAPHELYGAGAEGIRKAGYRDGFFIRRHDGSTGVSRSLLIDSQIQLCFDPAARRFAGIVFFHGLAAHGQKLVLPVRVIVVDIRAEKPRDLLCGHQGLTAAVACSGVILRAGADDAVLGDELGEGVRQSLVSARDRVFARLRPFIVFENGGYLPPGILEKDLLIHIVIFHFICILKAAEG